MSTFKNVTITDTLNILGAYTGIVKEKDGSLDCSDVENVESIILNKAYLIGPLIFNVLRFTTTTLSITKGTTGELLSLSKILRAEPIDLILSSQSAVNGTYTESIFNDTNISSWGSLRIFSSLSSPNTSFSIKLLTIGIKEEDL